MRTTEGIIDRVDALYGIIENTVHLEKQKWFDTRNIIKHSKNLIDLIEENDYVNGEKVVEVIKRHDEDTYILHVVSLNTYKFVTKKEIKTILTHEQFEKNMYRVGEI